MNCRLPIVDCRVPNSKIWGLKSFAIENRKSKITNGFTLIELLAVIAILALIAALAVPALKNLGKSNVNISAARQMLDEVGRARQLAMSQRTTVYMVFVPTNFWTTMPANEQNSPLTTNLLDKQLTGYNFYVIGQVGDQPGIHYPHYLLSTW